VRRGGAVAVAGQTGIGHAGTPHSTPAAQIRQALANQRAALQAAGADNSDVIAVRVYLADLGDFAELNRCYQEVFNQPYPARTTVGAMLPPGVLVEIDALAVTEPGTADGHASHG
jgi:enamine deaminase RidA (YjgF/YER057c/UK114 family)